MFKKIAIVGAAGLLTAAVLTQTKVGSYLSHQFDRAERHLESKIPPDEEIRRIKHDVASLDKDIDKAKGSLAEENVEVRYLAKKVEELRAQNEKSRTAVVARGQLVKDSAESQVVKWEGRNISHSKAKELLALEVSAHKSLEKEFKANETMLAVRERTREMAILRTLGYTPAEILQLVLGESVVISLFGGIAGLGLGWLLARGLQASPANFGFTGIKWQAAAIVLGMAAFIGLMAALVPAMVAARKNVVESLRFTG